MGKGCKVTAPVKNWHLCAVRNILSPAGEHGSTGVSRSGWANP